MRNTFRMGKYYGCDSFYSWRDEEKKNKNINKNKHDECLLRNVIDTTST